MAHTAEIFAKRQRLCEQLIDEAYEIKIFSLAKLADVLAKRDKPAGARGQAEP